MQGKFVFEKDTYTGDQLRPLFAYMKHGILGDSIVAWVGPCKVSDKFMKDGEDLRAGAKIEGDQMVHFIVELFDTDLFGAVALQRLLTSLAKDQLQTLTKAKPVEFAREGDDIFVGEKKLSISIATRGVYSSLIHFAVNCVSTGAPVPVCSLSDFGIEPKIFAEAIIDAFVKEVVSIQEARKKVFPSL